MTLGSLVFDEETGKRGLFLGYDKEGRKIGVDANDLTTVLERNHVDYQVRVNIVKCKEPFSLARLVAKFFLPNRIKEIVRNESLR